MSLRRRASTGTFLLAVFFLFCGLAFGAKTYPDRAGDVAGGSGPDIVSITLSNTEASIIFRVRFAKAPPLRVNERQRWVDMLLIGIDVPPLGPRPISPGGEWPGANFALGTHGPAKTGQLVRLGTGIPVHARQVATFKITTAGATLRFSIPRSVLGSATWFTFSAAAARETEETTGGGIDLTPARGTHRYILT